MNKLFFDIETAPAGEDKLELLQKLYQKKKEKDPSTLKSFEDFVSMTSFSGGLGTLICICYAINDGEIKSLSGNESVQIKEFWEITKQSDLLIGHNVLDFDLPFLKKKSVVLGIKYPNISLRRYASAPIFDTMHEWNSWGRSDGFSSLDALASILGFKSSKNELDGSKVADYYKSGKVAEIINYCKADIELTRNVYYKLSFEPVKIVKDGKLFP